LCEIAKKASKKLHSTAEQMLFVGTANGFKEYSPKVDGFVTLEQFHEQIEVFH
jgi:hypothetical protein